MLTRWDPFRELEQLHREIDRLFNGFGDRWPAPFSRFSFLPGLSARSYPLLNVLDEGEAYHVDALAPGIDPETLKVSVVSNELIIEGEKTAVDKDVKAEAYHRSERSTGRFVRSLTLPCEIDGEKVQAEYRNGLLSITLPKAEDARPRQIAVSFN